LRRGAYEDVIVVVVVAIDVVGTPVVVVVTSRLVVGKWAVVT
jgi:hypothetical protein